MPKPPSEARDPKTGMTPREVAFVDAYLTHNGNGAAAARDIGVTNSAAASTAYKLLRIQRVQQAIYERMAAEVALKAPKALGVIDHLMSNARSEFVRLQAAQDALDRAGIRAKSEGQTAGEITVKIDLGG